MKHREKVMLGGMIASIKHSHTKNPKPGTPSRYAMFDLEDTEGIMRTICWPEQFAQFGDMIQPDAICVFGGAIDKRPGSEEANFIVNEVIPIGDLEARYTTRHPRPPDRRDARPEKAGDALRNPPRLPRRGPLRAFARLVRRAESHLPLRQVSHRQPSRDAQPRRGLARRGKLSVDYREDRRQWKRARIKPTRERRARETLQVDKERMRR